MRNLYKSIGLLSMFFMLFIGETQVTLAIPHAIVKSCDIDKPDEQDKLVYHCLHGIRKYWCDRFSCKGNEYNQKELSWLIDLFGISDDVDKLLDSLIREKKFTLLELNKKFQEYYDLAMKSNRYRVDCRVVSSHVLGFLRSDEIKSYIMNFETAQGNVSHDVVIYAVLENGKENWYVCDMESARMEALKTFLQKGTSEDLFNTGEVINFLKYPLIDYVKDYVPSFECTVYDDAVGKDIIGETGYTDEYWLLGEFVKQKCTKEYQKKFLVDKLTKEEVSLLDDNISNISSLEKLPFRPYERQKGSIYNNEKTDLTFVPKLSMYGRLYSLKDAFTGKNYENVIFMPQQSL